MTPSPHRRPGQLHEHANRETATATGNAYSEHGAVGINVCWIDELLKVARRILPERSFYIHLFSRDKADAQK